MDEFLASDQSESTEPRDRFSESPTRDRLSELPNSLIHLILSFLPMRYVVWTSLLSKRWRNLWTSVPCLDFTKEGFDDDKFRNFVNRTMILWKRSKILKFKVHLSFGPSLSSDLDLWVRFAVENQVEELSLSLLSRESDQYCLPRGLYSCRSVRKLYLSGGNLKMIRSDIVHWSQLKSLTIGDVDLSGHALEQLLSATPQLEELMLCFYEVVREDLNIKSCSLKRLTIHLSCSDWNDDIEVREMRVLRIWAPNVESLELSGVVCSKCLLMDVSSLSDAKLDIHTLEYCVIERSFGYELYGEMLSGLLRSMVHVEKVTLSDWCIKVLEAMEEKDLLSPLSGVKVLKLYPLYDIPNGIVDLFAISPNLKMLVIERGSSWYSHDEGPYIYNDRELTLLKKCLERYFFQISPSPPF